jgi:Lrp/AsnC family transcriptional regulator, leucine-responsive regulatory protein
MSKIDSTDLRILRQLQQDASLTNVELAGNVQLSPSPTLGARQKTRERRRDLALRRAGGSACAWAEGECVRARGTGEAGGQALERFEQAVSHFDEVMEVYLMTGDEDYLLRIVVSDLQALRALHPREPNAHTGYQEYQIQLCAQAGEIQNSLAYRVASVDG